jgi:hypothetical protein
MKSLAMIFIFLIPFSGVAIAQTDWDSSPHNWKNSPYNWKNSPHNWRNNPHNWDNSPYKWNNDRIIRDNQGRAKGYAVPKEDGGVNYYDFDGNRKGYKPSQD